MRTHASTCALAAALALAAPAARVLAAPAAGAAGGSFHVVTDVVGDTPEGVAIVHSGEPFAPFGRPAPGLLDPTVLGDFHAELSLMQDLGESPAAANVFEVMSR